MDNFDKHAFFYIPLIFGIVVFFLIPYSNGIYYWQDVEKQAQKNIMELKEILEWRASTYTLFYIDINKYYAGLGSNFYKVKAGESWEKAEEYHRKHSDNYYDMILAIDSDCLSWFDTIVVIKHYTKHSDTIKVALEDL